MRGGALGVRFEGLDQFGYWKEDTARRYDHWHRTKESLAVGGPLAVEDTGQGTSATQTRSRWGRGRLAVESHSRSKTLVRGPVPPKQRVAGVEACSRSRATRDRRHWSGDQCHPNRESLGSGPARGRRCWAGDERPLVEILARESDGNDFRGRRCTCRGVDDPDGAGCEIGVPGEDLGNFLDGIADGSGRGTTNPELQSSVLKQRET